MHSKTMPIILNPKFTKISAIIIAYCVWYFVAGFMWVKHTVTVPVCFYQSQQRMIQAPETIQIKIVGPRKYIHYLNKKYITCNVDLSGFDVGVHDIILSESNLFLPEPLKLIELYPSIITITIQEATKL